MSRGPCNQGSSSPFDAAPAAIPDPRHAESTLASVLCQRPVLSREHRASTQGTATWKQPPHTPAYEPASNSQAPALERRAPGRGGGLRRAEMTSKNEILATRQIPFAGARGVTGRSHFDAPTLLSPAAGTQTASPTTWQHRGLSSGSSAVSHNMRMQAAPMIAPFRGVLLLQTSFPEPHPQNLSEPLPGPQKWAK